MKKTKLTVIVAIFCAVFGSQNAVAQTGADLASLDIVAIKEIQVRAEQDGYYATVSVLFQNDSTNPIKLKNTIFEVSFRDDGKIIPFGESNLDEMVIPEKAEGDAEGGQIERVLDLKIGPKNEETTLLLMKLFNLVGNPSNSLVMNLDGKGEVCNNVERGWICQSGISAELEFVPTIQREILFK